MKSLLTIFLVLSFVISFSQKPTTPKLPSPPNCVWITDSLFIDQTEIANIHWLEYLYYLKKDSIETHYQAALPDTTVWLRSPDSIKAESYLRHPGYRYYPVVGISYEQAVDYCKWRSAVVNQRNHHSDFIFAFRLPTEMEWELAAAGSLDPIIYPFGFSDYNQKPSLKKDWKIYYNSIQSSKKVEEEYFKKRFSTFRKNGSEPFFNCLKPFDSLFHYGALSPLTTSLVSKERTIKPNKSGIYDMIGNVAEMISEKSIAKGGSWGSFLEDCKIKKRTRYERPSPYVGFRCVCEVRVKK